MQKDNIFIPDHIFGWIETRPFSALSAAEQQEVLRYFPEEEYAEVHDVLAALEKSAAASRKEQLLERFDHVHNKVIALKYANRKSDLLKVAAVLVPLLTLAAYLMVSNDRDTRLASLAPAADTIYVERAGRTDTVVRHDTVYRSVRGPSDHSPSRHSITVSPAAVAGGPDAMQVLSIDQLNGIMNVSKGNSLKDDTLWQLFEPASL